MYGRCETLLSCTRWKKKTKFTVWPTLASSFLRLLHWLNQNTYILCQFIKQQQLHKQQTYYLHWIRSRIFAKLHSTKAHYGAASCFVTAMPLWRGVSNLNRDGAVGHIFCFSPVSLHGFSSPTNLAVGSVHYTVLYSPSIRASLPLDWRSHQNPREKSWTFTVHDGYEKEDPTGAKKQDTVWCESCFFKKPTLSFRASLVSPACYFLLCEWPVRLTQWWPHGLQTVFVV